MVSRDGRPAYADLRLRFLRSEPRSALSLLPDVFRDAALFRPGLVGAWSYWALLAAIVLLVPALLAAALRRADHDG